MIFHSPNRLFGNDVNPIQEGVSANLFGTGGEDGSGSPLTPKLIPPKSCNVYGANKKMEPITQKLGL